MSRHARENPDEPISHDWLAGQPRTAPASPLCRSGVSLWLNHDYDLHGACRRCQAVAPKMPGREA